MEHYDRAAAHKKIIEDFDKVQRYQATMGFTKKFPLYVDFYEGRQWPAPTRNTQGLPRPVLNITKMICRNKRSALLSVPTRIVYHAESYDEGGASALAFNRFAAYIQKEMHLDAANKRAVHDAVIKGSYFYHFYWDGDAEGLDASTTGALRVEVIEPLSIGFANPAERDEQKQEWILLISRERVSRVKELCDDKSELDRITADDRPADGYTVVEQDKDALCTVLTRYFKTHGEVWYERATKSVMLHKPRPLKPDVSRVSQEMMEVQGEGAKVVTSGKRARLYPIVAGAYEEREGSIFGIGEVEGIINNQRAINQHVAMSLKDAEQSAWSKWMVLPNALNGQRITNEPGQVLVDYSKTGNGIRRITPQALLSKPMDLVEALVALTRAATGATEVMTGEAIGANMSGAAIAQLQSQAGQPVEELRERFWDVQRKQGEVLAQFFRLYYYEEPYIYEDTEVQAEGGDVQMAEGFFTGAEFDAMRFDVVVETVRGSKSSNAGDINLLDTLLARGAIDVDTYLESYPDDAISDKSALREALMRGKDGQLGQALAQIEQLQAQLAVMGQERAATEKALGGVRTLAEQYKRLQKSYAELVAEATAKIMQANGAIEAGNAQIAETTADATEFAATLAANGMVPGEVRG
ncbi:MAG: hypothetical protein IJC99_04190 [Clostridia bacterium]|nr:hypothetical protein [Clostridia bacterium]